MFEQYDQLVGSRTVRRPGLDAAVLRIDGVRGIAVSLDGPPLGERDPFRAGWAAVMDAALNVACAGGEPLALTDCLNFGNPERGEIAWELGQAIEGIARAAEALGIPVVSGNVSLYNETGGRPIPPTPVVGCVGLVRDVTRDPVALAARRPRLPRFAARAPSSCASSGRTRTRFSLAHDVSDGGLALALREAAEWSRRATRPPTDAADGPGVIVALAPGEALDWPDVMRELGHRPMRHGDRPLRATFSGNPPPTPLASSLSREIVTCRSQNVRQLCANLIHSPDQRAPVEARTPDVRRLRHPRAGPRRRAARRTSGCTRSSTAARSRRASPSPSRAA